MLANLRALDARDAEFHVEVFPTQAEDLARSQTKQHGDEDHGSDMAGEFGVGGKRNPLVAGDEVGGAHLLLADFDLDQLALQGVALLGNDLPLHRAFEQEMEEGFDV